MRQIVDAADFQNAMKARSVEKNAKVEAHLKAWTSNATLSGPDVPWQSWVLLRFFAVKSLRGTSLSACLRGEKLNAKFWNPWPLKILQMRGFARQDFGGLSDLFLLQPAIASSFFSGYLPT